jgi:cytochrome c556
MEIVMRSTFMFKAIGLAGAFVLLAALPAHAQDRKIEQAIKHRRAAFTLMSTYVSRMVQTVDGGRPFDAARTLADAKAVEYLSRLPWEGFVDGSDRGDTRAVADIWLEEDRFRKMARDLETRTTALRQAAETADLKKFKQAFEPMRDACSACHKAFRKD